MPYHIFMLFVLHFKSLVALPCSSLMHLCIEFSSLKREQAIQTTFVVQTKLILKYSRLSPSQQ